MKSPGQTHGQVGLDAERIKGSLLVELGSGTQKAVKELAEQR